MQSKRKKPMSAENIVKVLRLHAGGSKVADIVRSSGISDSTVRRWLQRAAVLDMDYAQAQALGETELEAKFRVTSGPKPANRHPIDIQKVISQLEQRKTKLDTYWQYANEAGANHAAPLGKSAYFQRVNALLKELGQKPRDTVTIFTPGDYLESDMAGDKIELKPHEDGTPRYCQICVGTLPATNMIHATVVPDGTTASWVKAIVGDFKYFNGLPRHIKIDNDVALVKDATKGAKKYTADFVKFTEAYGDSFDVEAARIRAPRDKAGAEWAVKRVTDTFISQVKPRSLEREEDVQLLLDAVVENLNNTKSPTTGISPREDFNLREARALGKLPKFEYTPEGIVKKRKVKRNGCVSFEGHQYLVPHTYTEKEIKVRLGKDNNLYFMDIADDSPVGDYPHYKKGIPHETEGFKHAKEEYRGPQELTAERHLANAVELFGSIGEGAVKFLSAFLQTHKRKAKWGTADILIRLYKKLAKTDKKTANLACEQALAFGSPAGPLLETCLDACEAAELKNKKRKKKKKQSNKGACVRPRSELVPGSKTIN